jgi:hypothetical protein
MIYTLSHGPKKRKTAAVNQGECRSGVDVLQSGTKDKVGYMFTQPINVWKKNKNSGQRVTTTKVLSRKEWDRRMKNEKSLHDFQRKIFNENRKKEINTHCRGIKDNKEEPLPAGTSFHIPILVIESRFSREVTDKKQKQTTSTFVCLRSPADKIKKPDPKN